MLYDRCRVIGGQAVFHELPADLVGAADAHVEHHRLVRAGERFPVQIDAAVLRWPVAKTQICE